jgi:hypothetical protein
VIDSQENIFVSYHIGGIYYAYDKRKGSRVSAVSQKRDVYDPRTGAVSKSDNVALIARHILHGNKPQVAATEQRWAELALWCDALAYMEGGS